jgi:short-subunit dehydrogenase
MDSRGSIVMLYSSADWAPGSPLGVYAVTKASVDTFITALR